MENHPQPHESERKFEGCFDCNICLDFAHEPVVTVCGHLYCWPCIYKWLHVQSASLTPDEHPQCPVCKDDISHTTMVPLYGRGQDIAHSDHDGKASSYRGSCIPPRPPALGAQSLTATSSQSGQQLPYRNPYQNQHLYQEEDALSSQMLNPGATMILPPFGWDAWRDVFYQSLWELGKFIHLPKFLSPGGK